MCTVFNGEPLNVSATSVFGVQFERLIESWFTDTLIIGIGKAKFACVRLPCPSGSMKSASIPRVMSKGANGIDQSPAPFAIPCCSASVVSP